MSSFFTAPASQRKRKRSQPDDRPAAKRNAAPVQKRAEARDESISGSDSDGEARQNDAVDLDDSSSDSEAEDVASKRIRLAEQYLANTQREVLVEEGFDAVDVDQENLRARMGERLKEDSAEGKGKLYRWIANDLDWSKAEQRTEKMGGLSVTGVAIQGRNAYTVGKDMTLSKWELPTRETPVQDGKQVGRLRTKPKRVAYTRGARAKKNERDYVHHVGAILCVAASQDGKFVATGGLDKRIVIWDAATLKPLKVFTQHRDSVSSLAFRRGTNQLFSASRDRTVKIWSLDELAYVETLFGHQDEVVDVDALGAEKCVTVGARDRTARQWKVVEESQLVFRGGGAGSKSKTKGDRSTQNTGVPEQKAYNEGSMDRVACIDDETFITGSDNGSLSLWNVHKKKAVFTYPLAHGLDPPLPLEAVSAEAHPKVTALGDPQPRWITALRAIPFSDTFITGSWDGVVRTWRISEDKRRIEPVGALGVEEPNLLHIDSVSSETLSEDFAAANRPEEEDRKLIVGVINDLAIIDRGERAKEGVLVAAAVGKQHRLGRWSEMSEAKNCLVLFEVPRRGAGLVNGGAQSEPTKKVDQVIDGGQELGKGQTGVPASAANSEVEFDERSPASQQVVKEMREAAETGQSRKDHVVVGASPSKATALSSDLVNGNADGEEEDEEFAGFDD
ncbi:pre-rRNA processing protein [Elasticomyces elasticus]|nr:pre-rRNA processing protein [Elasticomyces elasticus]KAK3660926.1 pre-rRNA processing protein [Elasticomyces elasticus]KAK4932332.1 pre-rRNA processing protein [Elasticomyces elasticus]KAK5768340.1 pre-rRNA processing protein [Elasticomyces elasticus]